MALLALCISFVVLLVIGFPIAFNLILSSIVYLLVGDYPLTLVPQRMFQGMNGFALLAVPFFILTGQLMVKGSLLKSLTDFVNAFVGHVRGALALVTVGTCLFMGAIVGLAVAETASLGSFLIPMMKKEGYKPGFASGVMASASLLGPIMPPSVLMILYCISVGRTSIAGIFLASIIPAIMIAVAQMLVIYFIAKKNNLPNHDKTDWPEKWAQLQEGLPGPDAPRHHPGRHLRRDLHRDRGVGRRRGLCLHHLHVRHEGGQMARSAGDLHGNRRDLRPCHPACRKRDGDGLGDRQRADHRGDQRPAWPGVPAWAYLLLVNILLLINGMFMDDYASVIVLGPILAPIAWAMGVDPLQIGVIICVNLVIGLATPPFGITLFVTSPMAGVTIEETFKEGWPMIVASVGVLLLLTYVPPITLWLPRMFGY